MTKKQSHIDSINSVLTEIESNARSKAIVLETISNIEFNDEVKELMVEVAQWFRNIEGIARRGKGEKIRDHSG